VRSDENKKTITYGERLGLELDEEAPHSGNIRAFILLHLLGGVHQGNNTLPRVLSLKISFKLLQRDCLLFPTNTSMSVRARTNKKKMQ
jgi:hypothetical protein